MKENIGRVLLGLLLTFCLVTVVVTCPVSARPVLGPVGDLCHLWRRGENTSP